MKLNLKSLLALVLTLCLLLGSVAALAEATVEVSDEAVKINVDETVESTGSSALTAVSGIYNDEEYNYVIVGGQSVYSETNEEIKEIDVETESLNLETSNYYPIGILATSVDDLVTVSVDGDISVEGKNDSTFQSAYGIQTSAYWGGDTDIDVSGDITINAIQSVEGLSFHAREEGSTDVSIGGDIKATSSGSYAEGVVGLEVGSDATVKVDGSVEATGSSAYGVRMGGYAADANGKVEVGGDITANGRGGDAVGVSVNMTGGSADVTVDGKITTETTGVARGIIASSGANTSSHLDQETDQWVSEYHSSETKVTANGDVTVEGGGATALNASASGGTTTVNLTGDVNAVAKTGDALGVTASSGLSYMSAASDFKGNTDVVVNGDVTVTAEKETYTDEGEDYSYTYPLSSTGVSAKASEDTNTNVTVNGNVIAQGGSETIGLQLGAVTGYHSVNTGEVDEDGDEITKWVLDDVGGTANVTVNGDVTAKGENGVGIYMESEKNASVNVLIDGTLSAGDVAIKGLNETWTSYPETMTEREMEWFDIEDPKEYDYSNSNIYVWKAEENEDGRIVELVDTELRLVENPEYDESKRNEEYDDDYGYYDEEIDDYVSKYDRLEPVITVNQEASAKLEAAIWYIVKVADSVKAKLTAKGTGTYTANETTYDLAHQDDDVKLTLALGENEALDGIQYNDDKAAEYTANEDGSYTVKMLRGGAMLLGLKTHTHAAGSVVTENVVAPTCTKDGSHDEATYCTVCKKELSRKTVTDKATGHTAGVAVRENEVAATCQKAGSYDEVVYCTVCKAELSRTAKTVEKLAHTPGDPVEENRVEAKPGVKGSYDKVVYCTVCKEELSREVVAIPALPVEQKAEEAPVEEAAAEETAEEATAEYEFVYEPVSEETEVNGVKAADHQEAAKVLETVGEALEAESEGDDVTVTVTIPGVEKVLDEEEMKTFDTLPVKDRLLVALSALGIADDLGGAVEGMSDDAKALSDSIAERMEAMDEAEKQALLTAIAEEFPKGTVTVDGVEYESFSIDLVIDRDGDKTYERYTFYDDNGTWKLFGIEKGVYKEV